MTERIIERLTRVIRDSRAVLDKFDPPLTEEERAAVLGAIVASALREPVDQHHDRSARGGHITSAPSSESRDPSEALSAYDPEADPNPHRMPPNVLNWALWVLYLGARRSRPFRAPNSFISRFLTDQAGLPASPEAVDMALNRGMKGKRHEAYVFRQKLNRKWHWQITAAGDEYLQGLLAEREGSGKRR